MTIEITRPEAEALIHQCLQSGRFDDIDELIIQALRALQEQEPASPGAVLTNAERRKLEGRKSLVELFAESPFKGLNIEFDESEHDKDFGRDIEL